MQVKKQQLEPDMEQLTGSKLRKEYVKAVCGHPAYLTYMQSTSCQMLDRMKRKLESRLQGEISITSDMQVRKQQLELDMEQQTGSKLGKVYVKAVYCHPAYLTYMQSTS